MGSTNSSSNSTSQRDSGGKWRTLHVSVSPLFSNNTNKRKHNDISKHNIKLNTVTKQLFSDNQESMTVGNRMIPMQQLTDGIVNNLTCTKCSCSHQALAAKELYNNIANEFFPGNNKKKKKLRKKFEKYNRNLSKSSPRLHLSERTIGIATEIQCFCSVCGKEPIFETNASRTTLSRGYNANESYELNCMFLLALQLLGGGGADADVILGFLNVPNGSTFRSRTFHRLEEKLSPIICRITRDEIDKALQEEVYLQLQKENRVSDYEKWLQKENIQQPKLTASYDMGWQQKSSGRKYDSNSGHGLLIGSNTKKVIGFRVKSKTCRVCSTAKRENLHIPDHFCTKNHMRSSKAMEVDALLDLVIELWEKGVSLSTIVCDDDTTIRSNLKHSLAEKVRKKLMRKEDWPRTKGGYKKDCEGHSHSSKENFWETSLRVSEHAKPKEQSDKTLGVSTNGILRIHVT